MNETFKYLFTAVGVFVVYYLLSATYVFYCNGYKNLGNAFFFEWIAAPLYLAIKFLA